MNNFIEAFEHLYEWFLSNNLENQKVTLVFECEKLETIRALENYLKLEWKESLIYTKGITPADFNSGAVFGIPFEFRLKK